VRLIRIGLLAFVLVPFAAVAGGKAADAPRGCNSPVRGVPFALPAPLTARTSCGRYRIARDGTVSRLPSSPLPRLMHTVWASGVWAGSSQEHLVVGRSDHVLWRSRGRFRHEYEVDVLTVGPRSLAFSYGLRKTELYVARLDGAERRVAPRELPLGWTRAGLYTRRGETLLLSSWAGAVRATIARHVTHAAYDPLQQIVWFVARGRLFRAEGRRVRPLATIDQLGLTAGRVLQLQPLGRLFALQDPRRVVVLRSDGSLFASTRVPRSPRNLVTGQPTAAPGGTEVAFAVLRPDQRIVTQVHERGVETVYVLRPGRRAAAAVYAKHTWFNVCGHSASLAWHGPWLLYGASEGSTVLIDSQNGRTLGLGLLVRRLPGFSRDDSGSFSVSWG
jgi:hypothetical protein